MDMLGAKVEEELMELVLNLPEHIYSKLPKMQVHYFNNSPTAGRAIGTYRIELNRDLLGQHPGEMINETLPHELAHCIVHAIHDHRCKPHGAEWQDIMQLLGREPTRCHRMEQPNLKRKKQKRHAYECGCTIHMVTTAKHHKMIMKGQERSCNRCKGTLTYKDPQ